MYYKEKRYEIDKKTGCWNWLLSKTNDGYGVQCIEKQGIKKRIWLAHRVSYEQNVSKIPNGLCVLHKCDNPPCVNPSHLFLGTIQDNMKDRDMKGRNADFKGSNNGRAKLKDNQVRTIRRLYLRGGIKQVELAKRFGIDQTSVSDIVVGKTWGWL